MRRCINEQIKASLKALHVKNQKELSDRALSGVYSSTVSRSFRGTVNKNVLLSWKEGSLRTPQLSRSLATYDRPAKHDDVMYIGKVSFISC